MSRPRIIGMRLILAVVAMFCMQMVGTRTIASMRAQADDCEIAVPSGWQPYLVRAGDTLVTLAERGGTTVAILSAVNCLTTSELVAGMLLLTPGLAPALSATATDPVTETVTGTITGTVTEANRNAAPDVTPTFAAETPTLTVRASPSPLTSTSGPVTTTATATLPTARPPVPATPAPVRRAGALPIGSNELVVAALLIMAVSGLFVFALQPRRGATEEAEGHRAAWGANFAFLIGGFVLGTALFPWLQMTLSALIPSRVSAGVAVTLLLLLVLKERFLVRTEWRELSRLLSLLIALLLMLVLLNLVSHIGALLR